MDLLQLCTSRVTLLPSPPVLPFPFLLGLSGLGCPSPELEQVWLVPTCSEFAVFFTEQQWGEMPESQKMSPVPTVFAGSIIPSGSYGHADPFTQGRGPYRAWVRHMEEMRSCPSTSCDVFIMHKCNPCVQQQK